MQWSHNLRLHLHRDSFSVSQRGKLEISPNLRLLPIGAL